jgi:MFS family permease
LRFLLYSGLWSFAVNISAPFFNLYLLGDLNLDVSVVTLYGSLGAGANLLMLMFWGKLADRIGNRPLMITVGILVALTPLLWLEAGTTAIFLWVWFPLLHIVGGATWAAIDLCSGNLMMSVTPLRNQSIYFAIAAAVPGITGAIGITVGGFVATVTNFGGLPTVFALSAVLRLFALLPLVFVHEQRSVPLVQLMRVLFPVRQPTELIAFIVGNEELQSQIQSYHFPGQFWFNSYLDINRKLSVVPICPADNPYSLNLLDVIEVKVISPLELKGSYVFSIPKCNSFSVWRKFPPAGFVFN